MPGMEEAGWDSLRQAFPLSERDVRHIRELGRFSGEIIPEAVKHFYDELLKLDEARRVFTGGEEQMREQARLLTDWLTGLFRGPYDHSYYLDRRRVGEVHVRIGLPQHLMCLSIELIWQSLDEGFRSRSIPGLDEKLRSLHKLLMLELAVMLDSYKVKYSEQVRRIERSMMEEKLTRAEHLAEIGQLAASLAHEIKNPLAGISGAIQIIRENLGPDDPHREIVTEILGQIDRLDATVKDLLQYARPTPPEAKKVALGPLVERVLRVLKEAPPLRNVRIVYEGASPDAVVYADESQLEQLLMNLTLNAAQAVESGGVVELRVVPRNGAVELTVRDTGRGMSPDTRRRAFEPFFTTKAKGTGLGLPICRRIVEVHGGKIELDSETGRGTTVTVTLPANRPARAETDK
ncbi:MAG: hypothetical protein D6788_01950 [Planctomycetota bacterium]|nr:MAG: hypothetical protein D6788_01950 [Planctomycetota bacterium]